MIKTALSQIYITDSPAAILPPFFQSASDSVRAAIPDHDYTLYDGASLRSFIESEFERDVVTAFDRLRPYSYKADLGKYCLLFKKGGWCVDIGTRFLSRVNVSDDIRMVVFRDTGRHTLTPWATSCGVIYSRPGSIVFQKAIEIVLSNCKLDYYGITPLCPTGPNLFGEALAMTRQKDGLLVGDALDLTPTHQRKNRAFVLPDGSICATRKSSAGGDLQTLGGHGTNNYNSFWHARQVYEPESAK